MEVIVMTAEQEIEKKKLELPKQKGQGRDMMVIKHGMEGLTLTCKAVVRQDGNKDALECVFP